MILPETTLVKGHDDDSGEYYTSKPVIAFIEADCGSSALTPVIAKYSHSRGCDTVGWSQWEYTPWGEFEDTIEPEDIKGWVAIPDPKLVSILQSREMIK